MKIYFCKDNSFSHVSCIDNEIKVFVDVIHYLALEEGLSAVIHDLITQFRLSNVLSQLFDASSSCLLGSTFVYDLVAFILGSFTIFQN